MRTPIDPAEPDFGPSVFQDLIDRLVFYYWDLDTVLVAVGTSGRRMADELRERGLTAATVFEVAVPRVSGPDGRYVELDERTILDFLSRNRGRHFLVLDWRIVTGQRLRVLLDQLLCGDLASLRTAVGYDIKKRRYNIKLDELGVSVPHHMTN